MGDGVYGGPDIKEQKTGQLEVIPGVLRVNSAERRWLRQDNDAPEIPAQTPKKLTKYTTDNPRCTADDIQ